MTYRDPALARKTLDAIYRQDLYSFVWKTFDTLNQGRFIDAWHVRAMCLELEQLISG